MASSAEPAVLSPTLPSGTPGTEPCLHHLDGRNCLQPGRRLMSVGELVVDGPARKRLGPAYMIIMSTGSGCRLGQLALGRICGGPESRAPGLGSPLLGLGQAHLDLGASMESPSAFGSSVASHSTPFGDGLALHQITSLARRALAQSRSIFHSGCATSQQFDSWVLFFKKSSYHYRHFEAHDPCAGQP